METKFKPKDGSRINNEQASRYGSRIQELTKKKGFVTASLVLADASSPKSPLHDYFDWRDDVAAKKWRLEQASYLIRSIVVTIVKDDLKQPQIRQFFSVKSTPEMDTEESQVYVTLETVLSDSDKREEVVAYALRELKGWRDRYKQYNELENIVQFLDEHL